MRNEDTGKTSKLETSFAVEKSQQKLPSLFVTMDDVCNA